MLNFFGGDRGLPYDTALEPTIIEIAKRRLLDSYSFVSHVVTLNSSVVVGLGALALAGRASNKSLQHPHLLVTALVLLLISVVLGTVFLFLSATVTSVTAMYWATLQRRRQLATLDHDYQEHFVAGEFGKHKNIEWHRELHEKLPAARENIVKHYGTVQSLEVVYYRLEVAVVVMNFAAYSSLVIFIAKSI